MTQSDLDLADISQTLVRVAGTLARFCDRSEHNEGTDRGVVADAGHVLRDTATSALQACFVDPIGAYAARLADIEARHPLAGAGLFEADEALRHAKTWRTLQQAQSRHDAVYHPDVNGLAKIDQLRHYTLHLVKLAWLLQDTAIGRGELSFDEVLTDRIPDMLAFGIKLATVCGQLLSEEPVDS